jgi:hypothetical protein
MDVKRVAVVLEAKVAVLPSGKEVRADQFVAKTPYRLDVRELPTWKTALQGDLEVPAR